MAQIYQFKDFFILPWRVTVDNRLCWLQFRIKHFILQTDKWLRKIDIITSTNRLRYKTEIETLNHHFINCHDVFQLKKMGQMKCTLQTDLSFQSGRLIKYLKQQIISIKFILLKIKSSEQKITSKQSRGHNWAHFSHWPQ